MAEQTILIVQDDPDLHPLLEYVFEREGYETLAFERGDTAWEYLEDGGLPDCILLDLLVPGIDGFELLKRQRGSERVQPVPVVVLTDFKSEHSLTKALDLGADDYILEPFTATDLVLRVQRALQ